MKGKERKRMGMKNITIRQEQETNRKQRNCLSLSVSLLSYLPWPVVSVPLCELLSFSQTSTPSPDEAGSVGHALQEAEKIKQETNKNRRSKDNMSKIVLFFTLIWVDTSSLV